MELKNQNDTLKKNIQELEKEKNSKSEGTRFLMEEAIKSKAQNMRAKSKMGKRIVKPGVSIPKGIQSASRPVSRI